MTDDGIVSTPSPEAGEVRGGNEVPTNTWPMWLIALLPVTGLLAGVPGFRAPVAASGSGAPALTVPVAFVPLIIELMLAAADRRTLIRRGVVRPLHRGWAVIDPIHVIGRSGLVRRRARGSLAALRVWLAVSALVATVDLLPR